jgi:hypothetical protein
MRDYTVLAELDREGFNVIVDKTWDDLHPQDSFDTSINPDTGKPYYDIEEMCRKIDRGDLDWFMLRVRVMHEDVELAVNYVGGFLYEDAREVLTDGTAEDMIEESLDEARKRVPQLIAGLSKLVVDTAQV